MEIKKIQESTIQQSPAIVVLSTEAGTFTDQYLQNEQEHAYVKKQKNLHQDMVLINRLHQQVYICFTNKTLSGHTLSESLRKTGYKIQQNLERFQTTQIAIVSDASPDYVFNLLEGILLSLYRFNKYKTAPPAIYLKTIKVAHDHIEDEQLQHLLHISTGVEHARDLVNEPLSSLNAEELARRIQSLGKESGFTTEVFDKRKIEALRMGGLLAVNKGSTDPPTFTVMEWKPANSYNSSPFILIGKGIVYDTGGMSLKPTKNSMDHMKVDMAGAATVAGTMYALAKNQVPVHVIGLVPATDNRPGGNAYVPGDVIKMHNGLNVEVMNTDAEGRLLLADALSFAKRYNPAFVIDLATLTGSAAIALGTHGSVFMGTADKESKDALEKSGNRTYERLVEFPLWDEYDEMLKSDIADMKNVGGREAGAITAGKFLQRFTDFPWIHIDIAGTAWLNTQESYKGKGASGVGVRLLYDFFLNLNP